MAREFDLLLGWPLESKLQNRRPATNRSRKPRSDLGIAETYRSDGHLITFAPTGAGKGVRVIIPNLLNYRGPIFTIDPKGENFAVTARYRSQTLGHKIYVLDPFEVANENILNALGITRTRLNPLDIVAVSPETGPALNMMASIFSTDDSGSIEDGNFWQQSAEMLLAGAIGAALAKADIAQRPISFQDFVDVLTADDPVYQIAVLLDTIGKKLDVVSYKALSNFCGRAERERSGVLSTSLSYLTPFTSERVLYYLDRSTLDIADVIDGDKYSIYLIVPPSKLRSHALLTRLWVSMFLNAIMERKEKPVERTLFLLDECAQLGGLEALTKSVTLLRGYGLQVWMFFQDVSQLNQIYRGNAETILNNCAVAQTFGVTRQSAGILMEDLIGGFSAKEFVQLDPTQQVISLANQQPRIIRSMNYLEDGIFQDPSKKYDPNPLFARHEADRGNSFLYPRNITRRFS